MRRTVPWVTYILIAMNLAAFAVEIALGANPLSPTAQQMIDAGGNLPSLTLGGEPWRLVSSMFLHFGPVHLALNMVCLHRARMVEQIYGRLAFAVIYLLAGLGGGVAMLIAGPSNAVGAGASGAVFGVYGAFGAVLVIRRELVPEDLRSQLTGWLGRFLVINLAFGAVTAGISISAHIGGLIAGFGLGAALLAGGAASGATDDAVDTAGTGAANVVVTAVALGRRTRRALVLGAVGLAAVAAAVMVLPVKQDVPAVLKRFDDLERSTAAQYRTESHRLETHEITEVQLAAIIDRDVIAPYRALRQELAGLRDIRSELAPLVDRVRDFTTARLDWWETLVAILRQPEPEAREKLQKLLEGQEATLQTKLAALEAESSRQR